MFASPGSCRYLAMAVAGAVCGVAAAPAQTVIFVRHAEKADAPADDPKLTAAGQARAKLLAEMLRGARLTGVVTSSLRRTRDTAAPSAAMAQVTPIAVPIGNDTGVHVATVTTLIAGMPKDAVVLVVGHSNTIPLIASRLGATVPVTIPECAFDRLVVMHLGTDAPSTIVARYGAASANCPS